jgi:hypothetical protein
VVRHHGVDEVVHEGRDELWGRGGLRRGQGRYM